MSLADVVDEKPATPSTPLEPNISEHDEGDRNPVFGSLVGSDGDVVGLVAYSVYKQNKHDWLLAFGKLKGREPNEVELAAYIIGEATPRRLATYRLLAQATLEGKGPDVLVGEGHGSIWQPPTPTKTAAVGRAAAYLLTAAVIFALTLIAVRLGLLSPR